MFMAETLLQEHINLLRGMKNVAFMVLVSFAFWNFSSPAKTRTVLSSCGWEALIGTMEMSANSLKT